jgi:hypothetical protein
VGRRGRGGRGSEGAKSGGAGAEEADHDALDDEFGGGEEVGVAGVFGVEKRAAALEEKPFESRFAVDEGGDDVARARFARCEEDDVVFGDVGAEHGIAADAQGEKFGVGADAEGGGVNGDVAVGFLFVGGGEAGGDHAVEGNAEERAVSRMVGGVEEAAGFAGEAVEGAFLGERIDVALDGERAGETEMFLDLAEHGGDAVFALVGVNEIEDLLLAVGEGFGHDVFT